jgi:hypothetical protein
MVKGFYAAFPHCRLFKPMLPVVPSAQVKEPLKLPFLLLFILLCVLVVLSALNLLSTWGMYESGAHSFGIGYALSRLPRSAFEVMIPSVVLSLLLAGMRMARRQFSRFLGLLVCLVVSYAALVNGMIWLRALAQKSRPAPAAAVQYFRPTGFTPVGGALLSVRSVEGNTLSGVLLVDPAAKSARFTVFPDAKVSVSDNGVSVRLAGARPVTISGKPGLARGALFAADRFTGFFLRDFGVLTADFERLLAGSLPEFFAACFALLFLCTASFVFLRASRWPLLNILLLALAARGYVLLWHVLSVNLAPLIARTVTDRLLVRMFPAAAMAALGIILLLVDILFIPADRWKQVEES